MSAAPDIDVIDSRGSELARYRVSDGDRVLMGWPRPRGIEVTDVAVHGKSRGYVVDRGIAGVEQLRAFVADYLRQAERHDRCPMGALGLVMDQSDPVSLAGLIEAA